MCTIAPTIITFWGFGYSRALALPGRVSGHCPQKQNNESGRGSQGNQRSCAKAERHHCRHQAHLMVPLLLRTRLVCAPMSRQMTPRKQLSKLTVASCNTCQPRSLCHRLLGPSPSRPSTRPSSAALSSRPSIRGMRHGSFRNPHAAPNS